jgi:hypothetical protein
MSRKIGRAVVDAKRNAYGEYVVKAYDQQGRRYALADYFTDDKADAIATAAAMVKKVGA